LVAHLVAKNTYQMESKFCWLFVGHGHRNKTKTRLPGGLSQFLSTKRAKNQIFMAQNPLKTPETSHERGNFILDDSELISQVETFKTQIAAVTVPQPVILVSKFPHNTTACSCIVFVVFTDYSGYSDWLVSPTKV